ncbi:MAG: OmpA family protein [Bacteroidota bacterium]|nr:OmpA family protein [Bacteroidota bacterium]
MNRLFFLLLVVSFGCFAQNNPSNEPDIVNLGPNVNSPDSELNPKITADGKQLFFTRKGMEDGIPIEDIWVAEMGKDNKWKKAKRLDEPFNTGEKNSVSFVSTDGNYVIIKGTFNKKLEMSYKERGFSMIKKTKGGWSQPEKLIIEDYSTLDKGMHNGMTMAPNQSTIVFSLSETRDAVANDLYISFKKTDGTWTKPRTLGTTVNGPTNEFSPFIGADGVSLFFASDRPGLGETDIWLTKRLDETWERWSTPVNLGAPVNTPAKDGYYSIDASSQYAYMVSEKNSLGFADIIKVKLKKEQQANPVVLVTGKVFNIKTKQPVAANIIYEVLPEGIKAGEVNTDPVTGEYKIILPYGKKYGFLAHATGYLSEHNNLDLSSIAEYKEMKFDLKLVPIEVGQVVKMNNIFFEYKSTNLAPESYPELNRIVDELNENPTMEIEIEGHTDSKGSHEYNLKLSTERASTVQKYILSKGIPESRVKSVGYAATKPIADNETEEGRSINRRVEFTVMHK